MIDHRLESYWTALRVYRRVLRTPEQQRLWLERTLESPAGESVSLHVRRRLRKLIDGERRAAVPNSESWR